MGTAVMPRNRSIQLTRLPQNPILCPNDQHPWENNQVYGAGAVLHEGRVQLLYTATGQELKEEIGVLYRTNIGLATSGDGIHFKRDGTLPFLDKTGEEAVVIEPWGVEDARITKLGDTYYIVYVVASPEWERLALATTKDFQIIEKHGLLMGSILQRSGALFPEKIGGRYMLMHRPLPNIWISESDDLKTFDHSRMVLTDRDLPWCETRLGVAAPPIRLRNAWALIFHGCDRHGVYRLGIAWLDLEDPSRIIKLQQEPILEPQEHYELKNGIRTGVYACGAVALNDTLFVYYGASEAVVCVATVPMVELEI